MLWTYAPKETGECDVKIYIHHDGGKRYLSTKVKIHPDFWDEKRPKVKISHPFEAKLNSKIQMKRLEVENFLLEGGKLSNFGKKISDQENLLDFAEEFLKEIKAGLLRRIRPSKPVLYKSA